ncbi:type III-A CRISPR-associated protein Cas10/Csm1 [[Pasteurella] aerogenes]
MTALLSASCRVAFAALVHDLGKFAERAKLPISQDALDSHKTLYCPFNQDGGYHSHVHAAYTGYSIDQVETYLPPLIDGELYPFSSRQQSKDNSITNSLINAAAAHHKPDTFLQWVIATADRVASGFEREKFEKYNKSEAKNHYRARLLTLFEQIKISESVEELDDDSLAFRYPLAPMSVQTIFPAHRQQAETDNDEAAQKAYLKLWEQFVQGLATIPASHRQNWDLWLDHFDTAYQCFTGCIPSATAFGVKPEVSLYDHSKTTAALATALWRWHEENQLTGQDQAVKLADRSTSWNEQKFLLIQGDFFGIQDFIFSGGSDSNKQAAKLLRGRSFQVSLFTELAALKLLQACELPSTSQIINAAGKFLIVAPNTAKIKATVTQVQNELNQWFVENTYGLVGLGLATKEACCNDFIGDKFKALTKALFEQLKETKLQRLDLTDIGFFHSLDYGRESLACDLIEPIRPLVDNWLLGCFRNNMLREEHFTTTQEGCLLGKTGRIHFYQEYEKMIINWRKMLTENCYDLVQLFKTCNLDCSPQRRSSQLLPISQLQYEQNWKQLLEKYYFNQRTMLSNYEFYF